MPISSGRRDFPAHLPLRSNRVTVFLDRDGVINEDSREYVKTWAEFRFIGKSPEAVARLTEAGFRIIVITNQSGIGRGIIRPRDLAKMHERMREALRERGGEITDIFFCPHRPDEGCSCRKPRTDMIRMACDKYGIDPADAWMVGDSAKDIECAINAGCRSLLVMTGNGPAAEVELARKEIRIDHIANDLYDAADHIVAGQYTG